MKCRSDSSDGDGPRAPAASGDGSSDEPAKRQRTEPPPPLPPPSSSSLGEASSSSQPPPQQQQQTDSGEGEQPRVPDLGDDLIFEVLRRAEARTLAVAAGVSRGWRQLAEDERLWEAACVREWANLGFSEQQLRSVVLSLGGFRRLHGVYIRPLQQRGVGVPRQPGRRPVPMGRDQVQLSLSLFSIGFFQNMPTPPMPKKDKGKDGDKNGGGRCG